MHIIWITTQFPSSPKDTKGRFIYRTVKELSKHYSITVICLHSIVPPFLPMLKDFANARKIYKVWRQKYPKRPEAPKDLNAKVIFSKYIRLPRGKFHHLEGWFGYLSVNKHIKKIADENIIIHATWLFPEGDLANIIFKKYNVPFLVTLMGSDVHFLMKGSKKWKKSKEIINNATFITSVSKALYNSLEGKNVFIPKHKKYLTHTVYDFNKFTVINKIYVRKKINLRENIKIVFYAGTLRSLKNVDVLIKSFKMLKKVNNIKLLIAGRGNEEGNLKKLVVENNLEDSISFLGGLNGNELINYYNASDVFCLPSKNEGLPNVIIESLLCGTPVVASSVGEIPFIIKENENGFLVPPNNIEELAKKISRALNTTWNRDKLRKSVSFLSPENVLKEYQSIYYSINKLIK